MKIVLIHDDLMRRGGGEQVARCLHLAFPKIPIYTLAYQEKATYPYFKEQHIKVSWYNKWIKNETQMKWFFFPFGLLAMRGIKIEKDVDLVIMSTTYCSKYVNIPKSALVVAYCYTPFRLAWNPESYAQYLNAKGIKKILFNLVVSILRKIDFKSAQKIHYYIAMTEETKGRIQNSYQPKKGIKIIPPPVNFENFYISERIEDYYLVVSRLEYYKKVDLVIDTFNELGLPLIIVGKGTFEKEFKNRANDNIIFKSGISNEELATLYSKCKAFIFPQHEDYGITPLETNASGRPVIAYSKGGVLDTMIPYDGGNESKATAVFFDSQTIDSLKGAIKKFESLVFNSQFIRNHASNFRESLFIEQTKKYILKLYKNHFSNETNVLVK